MTRLLTFITQLRETVRFADVLDVIVVSIVVYTAINWFRRARSRFVMTGVAALTGLYFAARVLDMYLTLYLLQATVAVAVVALIVIFQEDIRRTFERIALAGPIGRRRAPLASEKVAGAVAAAVALMARQKTGALIVFQGREPLERHLAGGVELHGAVSEPLLLSIFDHHSPGHDGAVIIDGLQVRKFAVHLPLTTALDGSERFGTRHSAALGLSERSDAFIIVVSEERGQVSVARSGSLEVVDPAGLQRELDEFLSRLRPAPDASLFARLFARDLGTKLLSLAVALGAWIAILGYQAELVARTVSVPIVYRDVPEGWVLEQPKPLEARVTISGPNRAFQLLDPAHLSIWLDVREVRSGAQRVEIRPENVELPRGLSVHGIEPGGVTLVAWPTVPIEVTVAPATTGHLPRGLTLRAISVNPRRVKLLVPQPERSRYTTVRTNPVDLASVTQTTTLSRALIVPRDARLTETTPPEVEVTIELAPAKE
ncbi:MAG: diadenylate cyclase [Sorangiineae bacterium]|nr:diadenylate cyclase [Polyangiaceae bacterium]MEB2321979.1 diadenylate cyclase [Sorangiineae bacterium]